jgi:GNAT superfamily N-acetyltransferase
VPVAPEHALELAALFERSASPCFCRWWHFEGDKNAWLDRCYNAPADSRAELIAAVESGSPEARGVVAVEATGRILGWMKLTDASAVPKLYEQRLYRGLPCFSGPRDGVFTVGCFLVDDSVRHEGIAGGLLGAGLSLAKSLGARAVEAFPRRADILAAEEMWTGPFEIFERAGFSVVNDFAPYPVLRRSIEDGA